MKTTLTKEYIIDLLMRNDEAVKRAIIVLQELTDNKKLEELTDNKKLGRIVHGGWTMFDEVVGAKHYSMLQNSMGACSITSVEIASWRKMVKVGGTEIPKIGKYWKQLIAAAERKKNEKVGIDWITKRKDFTEIRDSYESLGDILERALKNKNNAITNNIYNEIVGGPYNEKG